MTIAALLSALFNLGAQTDFWNSTSAARDFWLIFAGGLVATAANFGLRAIRNRRNHHGRPFGHTPGG